MTVLEYVKVLDCDSVMHCTFKVFGKQEWFFYFVQDVEEGFNWDLVTWEDLDNWYKAGLKWLEEDGPANYEIESIELADEPTDKGDPFIKYRLTLRCKA